MMNAFRAQFRRPFQHVVRRSMGGGHGHAHSHEPHVPQFYDKLGKACLVATYLWIFYRVKADNGQLFGLYQPWLHEHDHDDHDEHHGHHDDEDDDE